MMANVDIYAIMVENYENRTATPISASNNSVQSTVINNNSVQQRYRFGPHDAQLQNNIIPIIK